MANDNVIELIVKVNDQATAKLRSISAAVGKASAIGLGLAVAALAAVVKASAEAQKAAAKLDAAYTANAGAVGLSSERLHALADELQRTTTFNDELVRSAEAVLLTFNRVRGEAFERTIRVAADLASMLDTDLVSATRLVGIALEDPARGMDRLRRAGVVLSEEQEKLVKRLAATGQGAKAQEIILGELENRVGGTAEALRNTLGGALTALQNAFGELLEQSSESTDGLTDALNTLTATLSDPANKRAVQDFFALFIDGATAAVQTVVGLGSIFNLVGDRTERLTKKIHGLQNQLALSKSPSHRAALQEQIEALGREQLALFDKLGQGLFTGKGAPQAALPALPSLGTGATQAELDKLQPVVVSATRMLTDFAAMLERTATSAQRAGTEYRALVGDLKALLEQGLITKDEFNKRLTEIQDAMLPEFEVTAEKITAASQKITEEVSRGADAAAEAWLEAFRGMENVLARFIFDPFKEGLDGLLRGFLDVIRQMAAHAAAAGLMQALFGDGKAGPLGKLLGGAAGGTREQTAEAKAAAIVADIKERAGACECIHAAMEASSMSIVQGITAGAGSIIAGIDGSLTRTSDEINNNARDVGNFLAKTEWDIVRYKEKQEQLGQALQGVFGLLLGFAGGFAKGGTIPPGRWGVVGEHGAEIAIGGSAGQTIVPMGAGASAAPYAPVYNINVDSRSDRASVLRDLTRLLDERDRVAAQQRLDQGTRGRRVG